MVRRLARSAVLGAVAAGLWSLPAAAHHSGAAYDGTKTLRIEGTVEGLLQAREAGGGAKLP